MLIIATAAMRDRPSFFNDHLDNKLPSKKNKIKHKTEKEREQNLWKKISQKQLHFSF